MDVDFTGQTELTTKELKHYSKGVSWTERLLINLLLLGAIGLFCWFVIMPVLEKSEFYTGGASEFFSIFGMDAPSGSLAVIQFRVALAIILAIFVLIQMVYRFILIPVTKNIVNKTADGYSAATNSYAGSVEYKIDRFGLEYNIQSANGVDRYKEYWRNFTDATYAPDSIRLYKGRKQTSIIFMRAFAGKERMVGQFIESTMNKLKQSKS